MDIKRLGPRDPCAGKGPEGRQWAQQKSCRAAGREREEERNEEEWDKRTRKGESKRENKKEGIRNEKVKEGRETGKKTNSGKKMGWEGKVNGAEGKRKKWEEVGGEKEKERSQ